MALKFALTNCCTNHECYEKKLLKKNKEVSRSFGIIGIGSTRRPEEIESIAFKVTDSTELNQ
eukprot:6194745-Ditylum_brightwellii.AAC.1